MFTADLAEAVSTMVWFIHDIDPIQAQYECKPHGTGQSVITVVLIAKLRRKTFQNPPQQSWSGGAANPKLEKRTAHVRLEILHPAKFRQSKSEKSKSILFDFSSSLSTFWLFGFSSYLSTLNGLNFVLLAAHVQLERHPAKIQTVRKWKVKKYTFRLFDFSKFHFSAFCFSTFRNSIRNPSTFRLFVFRLFEIDFAYFPPGALHHIFPTQNPPELSRGSPRTSSGCRPTRWDCRSTSRLSKEELISHLDVDNGKN